MGRKRRAMTSRKWKNRAKYSSIGRSEPSEPEIVLKVVEDEECAEPVEIVEAPIVPEVSLFNDPDPEPVKVVEVIEKPKPSRKPRKRTNRKKTVKKEE